MAAVRRVLAVTYQDGDSCVPHVGGAENHWRSRALLSLQQTTSRDRQASLPPRPATTVERAAPADLRACRSARPRAARAERQTSLADRDVEFLRRSASARSF